MSRLNAIGHIIVEWLAVILIVGWVFVAIGVRIAEGI